MKITGLQTDNRKQASNIEPSSRLDKAYKQIYSADPATFSDTNKPEENYISSEYFTFSWVIYEISKGDLQAEFIEACNYNS